MGLKKYQLLAGFKKFTESGTVSLFCDGLTFLK